jgi:hypothetical protein
LLLSTIYGKELSVLQNQQVGETVRELGLAGQNEKRYANHGRQLLYSYSGGACCVVCKVAKYFVSA